MTPLDYIRIDIDILSLQISDKAKLLLGLVKSFNKKGLMMSNSEIGSLLNCSGDNISRLLSEIQKFIDIKNPKSKYRKIFYSGRNAEVEDGYSGTNAEVKHSTPANGPGYSGTNAEHNLRNISNTFSFHLRKDGEFWYLPKEKYNQYCKTYPTLDIERELVKAAQWLVDNPTRRKTARGMPRFLNGWLSRAKPSPPQEYATRDLSDEEAEELMKEVIRDN